MRGEYILHRSNVLVRNRAPGETLIRDALAEGLASVQGAKPDLAAADDLCMSVGTLRNIRNRTNTASLKIVSDAAHCTDGKFLGPWLATLNLRAVPLTARCTTDSGVQTDLARLALKIAMALDPASPLDGNDARRGARHDRRSRPLSGAHGPDSPARGDGVKPPRDYPFPGLAKLQALRKRIGSLTVPELNAADVLEAMQRQAWLRDIGTGEA